MQAHGLTCTRGARLSVGRARRPLVVLSSSNGAGPSSFPSRPGGGAARFGSSFGDEVPSDAEGDVPMITTRPSGGAFRGLPTPTPGTAGEVGTVSFSRPGGGCTRFNMPAPLPPTPGTPSGPSSPIDMPSRFSRPAGGGSRLTPAGLGGDGSNGGTHGGNGGGSGGNGGSGGSGSGSGSGNPDDEPLRLSSVAPWAVAYAGLCAGLLWYNNNVLRKEQPAPVKSCCKGKKAAAVAEPAAAAEDAKKGGKK